MLYKFDGKQPVVGNNSYVSDIARVIGDVVIGDNCYIGHGAILRGDYGRIEIGDGTAVEEGAIVAEGGVVKLKQIIPPKVVAAGNPAKIVREIADKDQEFWNWGKQIYIDLAKKYLDIGMEPIDNG